MTDEEETQELKTTPRREWKEIPIRLTLEKNGDYGVDLFIEYVTAEINPGWPTISIRYGVAELFDGRQAKSAYESEVESQTEEFLELEGYIPKVEVDDEGNKVKLTKEEREDRARDVAEHSDLDYGSEALHELTSGVDDDPEISRIFKKQPDTFWTRDDYYGPNKDKSENQISWLQPDEQEFLDAVNRARSEISTEGGEVPITLKGYVDAVSAIMGRLERVDHMGILRKVVPVWSYMRLKYELKDEDSLKAMTETTLQEKKELLEQMRQWLKAHKTDMAQAARRMLDKKEEGSAEPSIKRKGTQMTVEGKKTELPPRFNPADNDYTEHLLDYYNAVGQDPEVPVNWLMLEGASPDEVIAAADKLYQSQSIDPPDYWAITAAALGADYHVGVTRENPTPSEERDTRKKLQRAIKEKHGETPDLVDRLFKKLRMRYKDKTDAEIMDMVKLELKFGKRQNPIFKTAREALKDALKRITTVEVVEYAPYEPPKERTMEESVAELEQVAKDITAEEQDAGVERMETSIEFVMTEMEAIEKEILDWRAANNDYTMDYITVAEKLGKRQRYEELLAGHGKPIHQELIQVTEEVEPEQRENPKDVASKAAKAFWEGKPSLGPKAIPMDEQVPRGQKPPKATERRDEVKIGGPEYGSPTLYYLWGHLIGRLAKNELGHLTLSISSSGFETNLTHNRIDNIIAEGQKRYPVLNKFSVHKEHNALWLNREHRLKTVDPEKPWRTHEWDTVCRLSETMYPLDEIKGKLPRYTTSIDLEVTMKENIDRLTGKALKLGIEEMEIPIDTPEEVEIAIDKIEVEIRAWRETNKDYDTSKLEAAGRIGKRDELEKLLKQSDELMARENPKTAYTPKGYVWKDVEVRCPVTGKYTWSCNLCALFQGRDMETIECGARKGKKYRLAKGQTKTGTTWDTFVLRGPAKKTGERVRAIGGD